MRTNEGAHAPESGDRVAQPRVPRKATATAGILPDSPSIFHVAGVLVHAPEPHTSRVAADIAHMSGAFVHASAGGKLAVTLEARDSAVIVEHLTAIQRLPGVVSAVLISEHSEPLDTIDEDP